MDELGLSLLLTFGPLIALFVIGLVFGTLTQRQHYRSLEQREAALKPFLLLNIGVPSARRGELVTGSTVVAYDFFRRVAIVLRKLIGGRFSMHERFIERARREAILRMAESAKARGATAVYNIRLVSANLGDSNSAMGGCEVLAYGTAIWEETHHG